MTTQAKLMTADELLAMPDDGSHKYELVQGELITMSPAGADHGAISVVIAARLLQYVKQRRLGTVYAADTGFVLASAPDTVRAPDAAFVRAERVVETPKYFPGAPDLAVEVISPNDRYSEVKSKVREYLAAGTSVVIVIDPNTRTATAHTPHGTRDFTIDDTLTVGDVIPGWSLPMRELFD
ncbi:MAG TPA: Uma2 family endonuclease [Thermoanaerobaculia bacterium]